MGLDLAGICGIHAGDGYLRNDRKRVELDISGGLDEIEYYDNHAVPLCEKVFGLPIKPRMFPSRGTCGFVVRDKKIALLMHSMGFPYGKKSLTVNVPNEIANCKDLEVYYRFIRGLFDTDGSLTFNKRFSGKYSNFKMTRHYCPRISFGTVSKNLFLGLQRLFDKTDFYYYIQEYLPKNPNYSTHYGLFLSGVFNLEKWMKKVGFKNPSKSSRHKIWKEFGFCPVNTTYEQRKQILNNELNPNTLYVDS